jgi:predicted unusual protein kinase regulating ubiquinone biosynthesis (AarF/ABC1/UbiB family)
MAVNVDDEVHGGRVRRVTPLVGLAGRTAGEAVVASLRNRRRDTEFHARQAARYAERLGRSRGVLMKAGQILSVVLPEPGVDSGFQGVYQAAFAKLQDDAPPMPAETTIEIITAELGRPPSAVFAEFDPQPIAAASIGQVHAARLPDGRPVAVKVQYPGVDEAIRADLRNTQLLATFLKLLATMMPNLTKLDVPAMAREVSARIGEEIDYRTEAANQRRFGENLRGHPFIRIPEVHDEFSTGRVLTMDFVDGLRYAEARTAGQDLRDRWGEVLFRFYLGGMYNLGLIHADPHPGNYLFHPDGTVSFLDFGCVRELPVARARGMTEAIWQTLDGDADGAWRAAAEWGFLDPADAPEPAELLAWFRTAYGYLLEPQPFTITPQYVNATMRDRVSSTSPHRAVARKMTMEGDLTMSVRMDVAATAAIGGLHARGPWRAICEEWLDGGIPATEYGELAAAFEAASR